ncbi:Uncharacterised protein [Vibrio cholerae]|nr:Uncharacterised protein [Vibrio cholerae]
MPTSQTLTQASRLTVTKGYQPYQHGCISKISIR